MNKYNVIWKVKGALNRIHSGIKSVFAPTEEKAKNDVQTLIHQKEFPELHPTEIEIIEAIKIYQFKY